MILPDINILIYAHNVESPRFSIASEWLRDILSGPVPVCFCWETINGFVKVATNARLDAPLKLPQALSIVESLLGLPNVILLGQTTRHLDILARVATQADAAGPMFSDAVLAAIAIEHNATLATTDADFERFKGLKTINPLDGSARR